MFYFQQDLCKSRMDFQQGYETFIQIVKEGSVAKLKQFLGTNGLRETTILANSYGENGDVPLLLAISGNHREMVEFLVNQLNVYTDQLGRFVWKGLEYTEVPPLFAAIIFEGNEQPSEHPSSLNSSFVEIIINKEMCSCYGDRFRLFLYSIELSTSIPRSQKIDVLELMGAAYLLNQFKDKKETADRRRDYGLLCWKKAMKLRELTTNEEPAFPKVPYNLSEFAQKAFENTPEFTTYIARTGANDLSRFVFSRFSSS